MRNHRRVHRLVALYGVLLLAFVSACARAPAQPHHALTAGAEPLRAHFNRDVGHVRVVILAAPT